MLTIQLQQLQFFAHHGLYAEEKLKGNNFEVAIEIETTINQKIESIEQTIDYTLIYEIVRKRMAIPTPLLETLAQEIVELIYASDNRIKSICLTVKKLTPPIEHFNGNVGVQIKKVF